MLQILFVQNRKGMVAEQRWRRRKRERGRERMEKEEEREEYLFFVLVDLRSHWMRRLRLF